MSVTNQPAEPGEFFILSGGGMSGQPENGTAYIQSQPSGVMFRFMDNSLFGISAMDIAAYSDVLPDISLIVLGYRWDGTILNTTFGGTGIEWRTVNFDAQWASGLARVEFLGFSGAYDPNWSVDNIQLSVPEPSCGMLLILGLSAFLLKKKRC